MHRRAAVGLLVGVLLVLAVRQAEPATGELARITELHIVVGTLDP